MTEAEALDMAAKAAGWPNGWGEASRFAPNNLFNAIRTHAKTIMENAVLKAENERLTAILAELNDTDIVARTMAENERLREALGNLINAYTANVDTYRVGGFYTDPETEDEVIEARTALIKEIDNGDR